jgi:phage-related protein
MTSAQRKDFHFIGSSKKDMRSMPEDVQDVFGSALLDAQYGDLPEGARPFGEGLPKDIMKLVEDYSGDTYRAAYTVVSSGVVYVLHVFKKKSKSGIATPTPDKDLVRSRFKAAQEHYFANYPTSSRNRGGSHER